MVELLVFGRNRIMKLFILYKSPENYAKSCKTKGVEPASLKGNFIEAPIR